ncbi:TraB/GumN family protein [Niabella pedocola]|uniref:TraB/GumN family protein n=1 Tax=Niabella pedocola TaxID=1752077 RepID=A0ABS8PQ18_9BACT|nr:TraB/GumN family protein [Niabella pedocola]MCD2423151.1 TraB/GumN family protein [Niabella pedocola]
MKRLHFNKYKHFRISGLFFLLLLAGLLSGMVLSAQESRSLLWKISGNQLQAPSYLLGTMHLVCGEDFEVPPKLKTVLKKVRTVTFEADIAAMDGADQLMDLMKPVPRILEKTPRVQRQLLDSLLKEYQLTPEALNYMSPFGITSVLTLKTFNCADPSAVKMMEKELLNLAETDSLQIDHLESVDFQIQMIRSMNTIDELLNTLKGMKEAPHFIKDLVQVYKTEDLPRLTGLMNDPAFMSTVQQTRLLKERNYNWMQLLPGKMKKASTLFAVGAGHLGGKSGLIQLLKQNGYTVTPVFE